jgi:hypothetical protein
MVGAPPCITRSYLEPATFLYYLPSLLVGVFQDPQYLDFAVEAIIPYNQNHRPRGEWWSVFSKSVTQVQKMALAAFLVDIGPLYSDTDDTMRATVEVAGRLWSN